MGLMGSLAVIILIGSFAKESISINIMRIGFISTRLNGTDGVSLEVEKWAKVLIKMGHEVFYCAGELGGYAKNGTKIPELHFAHHTIHALHLRAFGPDADSNPDALIDEIYETADTIRAPLRAFIRRNKLQLIIVQNALTIPMNLPLGICLTGLIAELGINTIAHHHDFFWERQRYKANAIMDLLDTTFPAKLPSIQHVTINSIAQQRLKARRGIDSAVIPNVLDFSTAPPKIDDFSRDLRKVIGVEPGQPMILQPTRVIPRKGIELAIELVHRLEMPNPSLYIIHNTSDEGLSYLHWLKRESSLLGVELKILEDHFSSSRGRKNGHKIYSLWDAYPHADFITYPSEYEGFGNALLEAVYFSLPILVNRYPVYNADIKPLGFEFTELDGFLNQQAVDQVKAVLADPGSYYKTAAKNFEIAQEYFSLEVLEKKLRNLMTMVK
jgi:glycosyltransferase involved in cell wall biosynthesis